LVLDFKEARGSLVTPAAEVKAGLNTGGGRLSDLGGDIIILLLPREREAGEDILLIRKKKEVENEKWRKERVAKDVDAEPTFDWGLPPPLDGASTTTLISLSCGGINSFCPTKLR
jgi:hypothetical protein